MESRTDRHTLGAAANKEGSLADKVLGDISKLLESVRHYGGLVEGIDEGEREKEDGAACPQVGDDLASLPLWAPHT